MDEELSLTELENSFMEDLNQLGDWFLQYEYLLALSADMPPVAHEERTEAAKVRGCQSSVWLVLSCSGGKIHVRADSEALIVRGIVSIVVSLLGGRTPEEITAYKPRFIEETNIGKQISTDRFRGVHSIIRAIQDFAAQHCGQFPKESEPDMNTTDRKKIVESLLSSSRQAAEREAAAILTEKNPSREFIHTHLKKYVLARFMLEETCAEDNLMELSLLSLERTLKLDKSLVRELDQAAPCNHATSESTKKVLLLYAIQRDLKIKPRPSDLTEAVTVHDLSNVVYAELRGPPALCGRVGQTLKNR